MNIVGIDPGSRNCGYAIVQIENNSLKLLEAVFIKIYERELQYPILKFVEGIDFGLKNQKNDFLGIKECFYA